MSRSDRNDLALQAWPILCGKRVMLEPTIDAHAWELRRILGTPEVSKWWGDAASSSDYPFDDPEAVRFSVMLDGVVRGLIQFYEELEARWRHATIDIFLDPAVHGMGIGRESLTVLIRYLIDERGHHRITIDPALANTAAIRCYEAVGFRRVGVMRKYERDLDGENWHDALLMDLLADEFEADPLAVTP